MTTFVFIVDLFDEELFKRIFLRLLGKNNVKLKQEKIPNPETYKEYGKQYNYYGMKYTLTFEEGSERMLDMESIKKTLENLNYKIYTIDNNTYKMVPEERIEVRLKTNFRSVQKRKRQNKTREARRQMERQMQERQMQEQRKKRPPKRRWKEQEENSKNPKKGRRMKPRMKPGMKPMHLYDNVMTLKF